jgi:hypothetical protein
MIVILPFRAYRTATCRVPTTPVHARIRARRSKPGDRLLQFRYAGVHDRGVSDDAVALSARNCAARALAQQDRPTQMIQPGGKTLSARPDRLSGGMPMCATGRREARIVILLAEDDVHVLHA